MTSKARFAALLAALICGSAAVGAQETTVEEARENLQKAAEKERLKRADMSFEAFMASVYREPGPNGKFIVSGDVTIANEKQLREFFEQSVRNKPPEPRPDVPELLLHQVGDLDAVWSDGEKRRLAYCVSTGFGSRHAAVVAAMADAAGAWEAVADLDFLHLAGEDGACDAANDAVVFDVRPVHLGEYLARAFFPPEARPTRNVQELEQMLHIARKFDVAGRDERNRALGRAGEERVLAHERAALRSAGRDDLARTVRWVSEEDGDGAGYDIASFEQDGRPRLIEVKTTNGWERTPFHITRNELAVADERRSEWCLFRLWNFSREPKAFELHPPLDAHVSLTPTTFQASFH